MTEKGKVFIVSENLGGMIKKSVPEYFNIQICKDDKIAYEKCLEFINPKENHVVILDNKKEDELIDLAVSLKKHHPRIKIIFIFSPLHKNTAVKVVKLGIKHIFSKPFFDGDLTDKIEEVMYK